MDIYVGKHPSAEASCVHTVVLHVSSLLSMSLSSWFWLTSSRIFSMLQSSLKFSCLSKEDNLSDVANLILLLLSASLVDRKDGIESPALYKTNSTENRNRNKFSWLLGEY